MPMSMEVATESANEPNHDQVVVVNLGDLHDKPVLSLSGKELGLNARQHFQLDRLETRSEVRINVIIPMKVVSSGFILGMFSESTSNLPSIEEFLDKYWFECTASVFSNIVRNVEFVLLDKTALD